MPVANQYGIDLGNILSTVSDLKTAQQNQESNAIKNNMLSNENNQEQASQQADKDFLKDPKAATANTVAQKLGWDKLTEEQRQQSITNIKQKINQHGIALNSIIGIQDPVKQKDAITQYVSTLSPDEQKDVAIKYGTNTDELQANLPHMMNDLLISDGGVSLLEQQAAAKTANENKMNQLNVVWGNKNAIADKNNDTKLDIADKNNDTKLKSVNINADSRKSIATYKASHPTANGKPTVLEMKASALVDNGDATDINDGIRQVMKSTTNTQTNNSLTGNTTTTSKKTYGNEDSNAKKNGSVVYDKQGNPYRVINGTPVRIK